jgi:hypothetical protein
VVEALRPGTCYALAVEAGQIDQDVLNNAEQLRELSQGAQRVTLTEGEQRYLSLTLVEG